MSTLTVEALENIAKLARQRIDAGLRHHGEQWRLGGRTGINFMMAKLRRLATPQPPKDDGEVPVRELIEQLQDACVTSDGTLLTDTAEPWGCDVGLLRKTIAALSALPQHPPVKPETNAKVAELDLVLRERGLPTVADALGYSRNFAAANPALSQTTRDHIEGLCSMLEIAAQHPPEERLPMADHVVKSLAAKCGVYYGNGKVDLGAPLYAFTPTEIIKFASCLTGADHA